MINLLIVDDEKTTRDTLYHKIDWEGLGITSVAVAGMAWMHWQSVRILNLISVCVM